MAALTPVLFERLDGVDLIIHLGDLDDVAVLEGLRHIAPVAAVRGNLHLPFPWPNDRRLPLSLDIEIDGQRLVATHGHFSFWNSFWEKRGMFRRQHRHLTNQRIMRRAPEKFPGADVYAFGHTHRALVERRDGVLFVNPGAVCPTPGEVTSVAHLTLTPNGAEAQILALSRTFHPLVRLWLVRL